MDYKKLEDLPQKIRYDLPKRAQKIFLKAYIENWEKYSDIKEKNMPQKSFAELKAWLEVEKKYSRNPVSGTWFDKEVLT